MHIEYISFLMLLGSSRCGSISDQSDPDDADDSRSTMQGAGCAGLHHHHHHHQTNAEEGLACDCISSRLHVCSFTYSSCSAAAGAAAGAAALSESQSDSDGADDDSRSTTQGAGCAGLHHHHHHHHQTKAVEGLACDCISSRCMSAFTSSSCSAAAG